MKEQHLQIIKEMLNDKGISYTLTVRQDFSTVLSFGQEEYGKLTNDMRVKGPHIIFTPDGFLTSII